MQLFVTRDGSSTWRTSTIAEGRTTSSVPSVFRMDTVDESSRGPETSRTYSLHISRDETLDGLYAAVEELENFGEESSNALTNAWLSYGNRRLPRNATRLSTLGMCDGSHVRVGRGGCGLKGGLMIKVRTLTGKEIEIDIEPTDTTERIKERVEEKEGIPPVQQRLIFAGKQMGEGKTAKDYNIEGGTVLHLVLALRGGR